MAKFGSVSGLPSAPMNVQASISGNRSVKLSWQLPSNTGRDNQVSSDILSFQVFRSLDENSSTPIYIAEIINFPTALFFTFQDQNLVPGTKYFYSIRGRNYACSTSASCGDFAFVNITALGLASKLILN